jgi:hypothetical protein
VANVHAILFDKINLRSKTEMPIAVKWRQELKKLILWQIFIVSIAESLTAA